MDFNVSEAVASYEKVKAADYVARAIQFKRDYREQTGHRPSLVAMIALYLEYKDKAEGNA